MDLQKIGLNLASLRKEKQLTQVQLSNQLGVSPQAISKWENGDNLPDIESLLNLAHIYDLSIE